MASVNDARSPTGSLGRLLARGAGRVGSVKLREVPADSLDTVSLRGLPRQDDPGFVLRGSISVLLDLVGLDAVADPGCWGARSGALLPEAVLMLAGCDILVDVGPAQPLPTHTHTHTHREGTDEGMFDDWGLCQEVVPWSTIGYRWRAYLKGVREQ